MDTTRVHIGTEEIREPTMADTPSGTGMGIFVKAMPVLLRQQQSPSGRM